MHGTVALTGASGFIGGAIARHLHSAGWHVRGLVRSPRQAQSLQTLGIEAVIGTLAHSESLHQLVQDCSCVIHCAASLRGTCREDFYQPNVIGTSNVIKACLARPSLPRLVHVSSLAAREPALSPYAWSKYESESVVTREANELQWIIIRPPAVYGEHDLSLLPLLKLIRRGIGIQLGPSHAKFSMIHVDDLAQAILYWLNHEGPPFHTWEVDDGHPGGYSWKEVFRCANPHFLLTLRIPPILLQQLARSNEMFSRIFGYRPLFTRGKAAELLHPDWVCDSSQVFGTLGWQPQISLEEGLRRLLT